MKDPTEPVSFSAFDEKPEEPPPRGPPVDVDAFFELFVGVLLLLATGLAAVPLILLLTVCIEGSHLPLATLLVGLGFFGVGCREK